VLTSASLVQEKSEASKSVGVDADLTMFATNRKKTTAAN